MWLQAIVNSAEALQKLWTCCSECDGSDVIMVVTDFFNTEYPRVGGNSNKISSDGAFVTRYVRSIVLDIVVRKGNVRELQIFTGQ